MSKIVIDVALLPPEEIMDICIKINQADNSQPFISLAKDDWRPHLSLAMAAVEKNDISKINQKIEEIAESTEALKLKVSGIHHEVMPNQKASKLFAVEANKELADLHQKLFAAIWPYASYQVDIGMFYADSGGSIEPVSTYWVSNYGKKYGHREKYHPHITLGCGQAEHDQFPLQFTASRLAVCQMGSYCTCRHLLFQTNLKK